jgi:hypothetical protein
MPNRLETALPQNARFRPRGLPGPSINACARDLLKRGEGMGTDSAGFYCW